MKNIETSFDEIIDNLLLVLKPIESEPQISKQIIVLKQLRQRLFSGEIHIAIIGQFNRGKSSFINKLVKKDILPTSVLPLTAIPTEIRFGEETKAVIDFRDGSQKECEEKGIKNFLNTFVTENNNPENRAGVSKAVVFCNSEFLAGSTIIIDTPGFGSTHVHNTKATLDILPNCDAVFFMLSADLPITQMEVNFVKQIVPQSSRIFFVYNKIDLLNKADLKETSDFITKTIKGKLGIDVGNWFLAVSAKTEAGMDVISNEVMGFLRKEKFFSLSQAIERKLFASIDAISKYVSSTTATLNDELNAVRIQLEDLKKEFAENEKSVKKFAELKEQWKNFPFFMPKIEKIKKISAQISDIEIMNLLLESKTNVFEEKHKLYSNKNAEIYKKITENERKFVKIEESQKTSRQIIEDIQNCINLYIQ
ncbi:MAG: dynamin family protein [Chitinivibrionia bacterium]|nr:dynamin family protein [Chitinivibrionia bacterium]